jgi:glycosyltransferase involved in cell wall biosynthesis
MIPTYRRPVDLRRCLDAISVQSLPAEDVIVIVRDSDAETWNLLRSGDFAGLPLHLVSVSEPGQVQALNAGLAEVTSDFVAITDDDAAPHRDWTERIVAQFAASPKIGGVGGRDYLHIGGVLQDGRARIVGKVPVVGKTFGNHHIGFGPSREVDVLKGVNGAYRTGAIKPIGFDTRLRGTGAQVHWEISLGIALQRAGWKLIYDPQIAVDHYLAPRFDEDQRNAFNALAMENKGYNEALIRMTHLSSIERVAYFCWAILVGTKALPGFVQWARFFPSEGSFAGAQLAAALRGRFQAWNDTWGRGSSVSGFSR